LNKLVDFVEAHKNGDYKIQLHMSNIKMWDKYNDTDNCYKLEYDKNKYIGFSADYMKRLYALTGDNCITIIDSKSPIYISGVGIECVFLPCWLDDNYNADNYAVFLEELKACYIQDAKAKEENEKQKALKNADKIEKEVIYNGFTLYFAGRQLFLISDKKRVTNDITNDFMKIMSDITGIDYINKITENDYKYYKSGVQAATITKTTSYYGNEEIYRIETKYNSENFYKNEYDRLIIYNGNMEKIDICADDMSTETKEETPNNADIVKDDTCTDTDKAATTDINNRTTETMQTDARQDTRQTETPAHKSNNCLFVTVAKDIKPDKVAQLQNVANLPTLASVPTYSAYLAQKINNIVNTKRNTNNGRKAHKRTNGATLAECVGVLKTVNTS
jgi:hypothetical protein